MFFYRKWLHHFSSKTCYIIIEKLFHESIVIYDSRTWLWKNPSLESSGMYLHRTLYLYLLSRCTGGGVSTRISSIVLGTEDRNLAFLQYLFEERHAGLIQKPEMIVSAMP